MIEKIISGGQTGADQIGLKVGRKLGITTGGTAPKGWKTEKGPKPELAEYGLIESWSDDYSVRTEDNVRDADVTIILGNLTTPGSKCTLKAIKKHKKPYIANPTFHQFLTFLVQHSQLKILNVSGNRGSKLSPNERHKFGILLLTTIQTFNDLD